MGYAERKNQNSVWNKRRIMNTQSDIASPITNDPKSFVKVSTPDRDEPMVLELTLQNIWGYLCRMLNPNQSRSQSHALTS